MSALMEKLEAKYPDIEPFWLKSIVFTAVDFFLDNISETAINNGAYFNSPLNGDNNMIKSYGEILWTQYEEFDDQKPSVQGPWVSIDPYEGIKVHPERPEYKIVINKEGGLTPLLLFATLNNQINGERKCKSIASPLSRTARNFSKFGTLQSA